MASSGYGELKCRNMPVFVVDGKRTPEIAINDQSAIDRGKPNILHYAARGKRATDQVRQLAGCGSAWAGPLTCDEYPFASSMEGGLGAQLRSVSIAEQRIQGGTLSAFISANKLKAGDEFQVMVINVRRDGNTYVAG